MSVCGKELTVRKPHHVEAVLILILPEGFYEQIRTQLIRDYSISQEDIKPWQYCLHTIKKEILRRYEKNPNPQIRDILEYLKDHELDVFYNVVKIGKSAEYMNFSVHRDENNGLLYSFWKGRRMYFKRSMNRKNLVQNYFRGIVREQSVHSPHCYDQPGFTVKENDVVVDAGAAEGFFALECADHSLCVSSGGHGRGLSNFLLERHFTVSFSEGYMFFPYGEKISPQLRHGLVLAKKYLRKKVFVGGIGKYASAVIECIDPERAVIEGAIDSMPHDSDSVWNDFPICYPEEVKEWDYDLIVVTAKNDDDIVKTALKVGLNREKLFLFWREEEARADIFDRCRTTLLKQDILLQKYKRRFQNAAYEYCSETGPVLHSAKELFARLRKERASLCRFGDGEFEMIRGKERPWFQKPDRCLADRLLEVLNTSAPGILLAVPDIFGSLDAYTEDAADSIREYINRETREAIYDFLPMDKVYYDAYITRPYLIYQDKNRAADIFGMFRGLWEGRDVLLVEGEYSRIGIGNDLLKEAKSVRRILAPAQNAFGVYDSIRECVLEKAEKENLVLISLGPTATVLAYDLALHGIQAIDIGQLDNEYEWSLCKAKNRVPIAGKGVAELSWCHRPEEVKDEIYERQITARVLL